MNKFLLPIVVINILFLGCENIREKSAEELLHNEKMEADIYSAILKDSAHLNRLLDRFEKNDNSFRQLMRRESFIGACLHTENADSLIFKDSIFMGLLTDKMIAKMSRDTAYCRKSCSKFMHNATIHKYVKKSCCK